jgi:hypothetical protein
MKTPPAAAASDSHPTHPTHAEIAAAAYALWEREGRPEGRSVEHWMRSRVQLQREIDARLARRSEPRRKLGLIEIKPRRGRG